MISDKRIVNGGAREKGEMNQNMGLEFWRRLIWEWVMDRIGEIHS
jgi:hypothetical protein